MGMERHVCQDSEKPIYWYTDDGGFADHGDSDDVPITCGWYIYDSPDGFVWSRRPQMQMSNCIVMDGSRAHGFDEDLDAWIFWFRARNSYKFRTIGVSIARDLNTIPFPQAILVPDADDPPDREFDRLSTLKVPGGYVGLLTLMERGQCPGSQLAFSRDARTWSRPAGRDLYPDRRRQRGMG